MEAKVLFRALTHQIVLICGILTACPALVSAQTNDAMNFGQLLDMARDHVGSAIFVDAEAVTVSERAALKFLFRTDDGTLLSVSLDVKTAEPVTQRRTGSSDTATSHQGNDRFTQNDRPRDGNDTLQRSNTRDTENNATGRNERQAPAQDQRRASSTDKRSDRE